MNGESIFVIVGICVMIVALLLDKMRPGLTILAVAITFMAAGVISADELAAGFSNRGVLTVAMLFLLSEGVRRSGALDLFVSKIFPSNGVKRGSRLMARILPPVAALSAFLNNTAIVVIFAPIIKRWGEKVGISPKKLLIPLSYATIMGGLCTLIGTSTNLVVHGMMIDAGYEGFSTFELGKIGLIITVVGIIYLIFFGDKLLPGDKEKEDGCDPNVTLGTQKEYIYEVVIPASSPFVGQEVVGSLLEEIPMFRVSCIRRGGKQINPKRGNRYTLQADDKLLLSGRSDYIDIIISTKGLELPLMHGVHMREFAKRATTQVEVVLSNRCPGVGKSIKEFSFFNHYHAIVLAIHRNGKVVTSDISSHILQNGDTLILMTDGTFTSTWSESSAFYLIAETGDIPSQPSGTKRWIGTALVSLMLLGATLGKTLIPMHLGGDYDMFYFVAFATVIMAIFGLFPAKRYTKFIGWDILIAIAGAFAISKAMINAGVAEWIATFIVDSTTTFGPVGALVMLYLFTMVLTELITNSAAVALAFPVAATLSQILSVNAMPLFVAICVAASSSFASPIGYQTNLIVQGMGGYRARDFLKVGLPLNLIIMIISLLLIPIIWKF